MSKVCLDTSAYSHFKRGTEVVVTLIDCSEWVGVPSIVLGELRTGFALGRRSRENERELAKFLDNPVVNVLDVDDSASQIYADIVVALRRAGTPLPTNDIWIAAVAAREGASVVTFDSHFLAIQRVGSQVLTQD
ncbi:MAG TPA: type II toxin-antitoxin system VapC family toxin [Polyangiaceae bacterium]